MSTSTATFYIADPVDLTNETVLVDLNSVWTTGYGFSLMESPNFGDIETEPEWLDQSPYPGSIQAARRHPIVEMKFKLRAEAPDGGDVGDIYNSVSTLMQAIDDGGTLVWSETGADTYYYDFLSSPLPALHHGQADAGFFLQRLSDSEGMEFTVWCQPYAYGGPRVLVNQLISLSGDRAMFLHNPGTMDSPSTITVTPTTNGSKVPASVQMRFGVKSHGLLDEFQANYKKELENSTALDSQTTVVADATCSGGSKLRTAFGGIQGFKERWRQSVNLSDPLAMAGAYRVYIVMAPKQGLELNVQLRWGLANVSPLEVANEKIHLDGTNTATAEYVALDMGRIYLPHDFSKFVIEGYAEELSYTGPGGQDTLDWDYVFFMPIDEQMTTVSVPGLRQGSAGTESWQGDDTVITAGGGSIQGDVRRIHTNGDIASSPPSTGMYLAAGRYVATAQISLENADKTKVTLGTFKVRDLTTPADRGVFSLVTKNGQKRTTITAKIPFTVAANEIQGGAAQKLFSFLTSFTNGTNTGRFIYLKSIQISYIRTATDSPMLLDGINRQAMLQNTAGLRTSNLVVEGDYITVPGGDSVLCVDMGEVQSDTGWATADVREPLQQEDPLMSYLVEVVVRPAYPIR